MAEPDLWIFGYGSLIWRADFAFEERVAASIRHYARRFWQGSPDHRGTPEQPGRVVTLVPSHGEVCQGMAYRIHPEHQADVLEHLDFREQGGYERLELGLHLVDGRRVSGLTYFAGRDNPHFLGHASEEAMLQQFQSAVGPSGPNSEYLLRLDEALEQLGTPDPHIRVLAKALRDRYS